MPAPYDNTLYERMLNVFDEYTTRPVFSGAMDPPTNPTRGPTDPTDHPALPPLVVRDREERREARVQATAVLDWVERHQEWWVAARAWHEVSSPESGRGCGLTRTKVDGPVVEAREAQEAAERARERVAEAERRREAAAARSAAAAARATEARVGAGPSRIVSVTYPSTPSAPRPTQATDVRDSGDEAEGEEEADEPSGPERAAR